MGPHPQEGAAAFATQRDCLAGPLSHTTLAADIRKGVALGLKALGGSIAMGNLQSPTTEGDAKTRYTDDDIAAIMGFSHVHRGDQVQPIWATLNNAKQKNLNTFRRKLLSRMTDWGYDRRIPIDTGVFLDVDVVKSIVELKLIPRDGVAHLNSGGKGLLILSCQGCTTGEIKHLKEREEALTATEKTEARWQHWQTHLAPMGFDPYLQSTTFEQRIRDLHNAFAQGTMAADDRSRLQQLQAQSWLLGRRYPWPLETIRPSF
jgi:hypothetical protein